MKRCLCLLEAKHPLVYDCWLKNKTCLYGRIFLRILECYRDGVKGLYASLLTVKKIRWEGFAVPGERLCICFLTTCLTHFMKAELISELSSFCVTMVPCCLRWLLWLSCAVPEEEQGGSCLFWAQVLSTCMHAQVAADGTWPLTEVGHKLQGLTCSTRVS